MIERGDSTEGILYVIPGFSYHEVEEMRRECEKSFIVWNIKKSENIYCLSCFSNRQYQWNVQIAVIQLKSIW